MNHFIFLFDRYGQGTGNKLYQWLATGRWFTPVSSTNKTDRHDIIEILLKVALNTITLTLTLILILSTCNLFCVNLIKCLAVKVIGWLSLNSKSGIFQIYHGENKLHVDKINMRVRVRVMVFNATFSNISIISWRSPVRSNQRLLNWYLIFLSKTRNINKQEQNLCGSDNVYN
jgi:hypothetical protein